MLLYNLDVKTMLLFNLDDVSMETSIFWWAQPGHASRNVSFTSWVKLCFLAGVVSLMGMISQVIKDKGEWILLWEKGREGCGPRLSPCWHCLLLAVVHAKLAVSWDPGNCFVTTASLVEGALGLQTCTVSYKFSWILESWPQDSCFSGKHFTQGAVYSLPFHFLLTAVLSWSLWFKSSHLGIECISFLIQPPFFKVSLLKTQSMYIKRHK